MFGDINWRPSLACGILTVFDKHSLLLMSSPTWSFSSLTIGVIGDDVDPSV
jgi:hypothetical protein